MDAPGATEANETVHQDHPKQESSAAQGSTSIDDTDEHAQRTQGVGYGKGDDHEEESGEGEDGDEEEDDDAEDEEPRLKYANVTKQLGAVYRNGDATSSFLTAGDKMIIGTHNGRIHVLSLPLLQPLRVYHAHSASVTSISVSPFHPFPSAKVDAVSRLAFEEQSGAVRSSSSSASLRSQSRQHHQGAPAASPSNSIYIASSSIDGKVCVASLVDPKDILLRNFGRPVQAVALSPEYKSDRTFISGGRAGDLILTTGGRVGASTNSTTMGGAAAAASSWLGSMGLGANNGKDTILHSGEGAISTIKWSLSGKYITWVNEEGIKIMRSNLQLGSLDPDLAWKRISHIDRPSLPGWEEMASVWKARADWVDERFLENDDDSTPPQSAIAGEPVEKLVVGWGGTVWIVNVYPKRPNKVAGDNGIGTAEVATILRTDCIISGISLYTPNLLVVLAFIEAEQDSSEERAGTRRRGRGLEPELRIIDIDTKEELSADTISTSRFENLSSSDYHMSVLPQWKTPVPITRHGTLGALGSGLWDATMYPARLFNSSAASIRSTTSGDDRSPNKAPNSFASRHVPSDESVPKEVQEAAESIGTKIFVHSPYDCVVAVKRDLADRLAWLESRSRYEDAWELIDEHPEAAGAASEPSDSISEAAANSRNNLGDTYDDRASTTTATTTGRAAVSLSEQEKRRIGELWIGKLVKDNKWTEAAAVCGKVLNTVIAWEHWAWVFIKNDKLVEITPYIPTHIHPPLPTLIYEVILKHYISQDRHRLKEILDAWPCDLFDSNNVAAIVEEQLKSEQLTAESEDWQILTESLAKLSLAGGHYSEALHCYIRLHDADAAMSLLREHRLLDAVSDDIPAFILIRVSKEQMKSAPITELEEVTAEPIRLLVSEAYTGIVRPETVVSQLLAANRRLFLYFYLRALWRGEALPHDAAKPRRGRGAHVKDAANKLAADEGKTLVDNFSDTAVELFADYDRPLLMEFLQTSTAYSFDTATTICETRRFTTESIYLLSKVGQTKRALNLILSELKDVSRAISFAKSQDDPDLWEDLLDYSMDKPRFIQGLLVEAGTSIDPIKLVKRIPSGLEIEGLREGLTRMIREHDLQASISQGAAKVLQSEVALGMDTLRQGQRRGIKFNVVEPKKKEQDQEQRVEPGPSSSDAQSQKNGKLEDSTISDADTVTEKTLTATKRAPIPQSGRCGGCQAPFHTNEKEILVGFACGHIFHLSHVNPKPTSTNEDDENREDTGNQTPKPSLPLYTHTADEPSMSTTPRTVGPKVTTARILRDRVGDGCRICAEEKEIEGVTGAD